MEKSSPWIRVTDKSPDGTQSCVICWRGEDGRWQVATAFCGYSGASGEFGGEHPAPVFFAFDEQKHVRRYEKAEYWMPIPEPPEQSAEANDNEHIE